MVIAQSRLTAQGQVSIPADVRRKLGIGPGSVIEWNEEGGNVVVRRAGKFSSEDIHKALFPDGPPLVKTLDEMKEGIALHMRRRYARD